MFLLDTNVLSEMMAAAPNDAVARWIKSQASDDLFTAAVCQAEILAGIGVLPPGRRRAALAEAARAMFADDFDGRIFLSIPVRLRPTPTCSQFVGEADGGLALSI